MTVQRRSIFGDPLPSGSSGDGASQDWPTDYTPPNPSARQSTAGSDHNVGTSRGDELTSAYRDTAARYSSIADDGSQGSAGVELEHSDESADVDDTFHTTGSVSGDAGAGVGIAGSDPLRTRASGADRGDTGAGKAIG